MSSSGPTEAGPVVCDQLYDLIVVGVACSEEIIAAPSLPALDSHGEFEIRGRRRGVGGNGLNVAVHAARLGADVALISKIPRNIWPEVTAALRNPGVDVSLLVPEYVVPALDVLLVTYDQGEYGVSVSDRTGLAFFPEDFDHVSGLPARYVHIDGFTLGALNLERQARSACRLLDLASSSGAALSVDLNRAIGDSQSERVRRIVAHADILFANAYEALAIAEVSTLEEAVCILVDWGVPAVVVKNGSAGLICATSQRQDCLAAFDLPAADSVGAGDGVAAGSLWGLLRGLDLHDAARIGAAVAALVCTGHGSQGAEFNRADVDRLLEQA